MPALLAHQTCPHCWRTKHASDVCMPALLTRLPCCPAPQAARDIAETMAKSRNIVYLPSQGNMLMNINPN